MNNGIAWIGFGKKPCFAARPLLGRLCREHVKAALSEAGIVAFSDSAADGASAQCFDATEESPILWIREDAPCVTGKTLLRLVSLAAEGKPAVLYAVQPQNQPTEVLGQKSPSQEILAAAFSANSIPSPITGEALLGAALKAMPSAITLCEADPSECILVESGIAYAAAFSVLRSRIAAKHLSRGVIITEPERTVIEADVEIGEGTLIYGGNTLQGHTVVGRDCTLYPNNRTENARIGDETTVESSVLLDCAVGSHTTVGPFAFLRPKTIIGDHCRIGDFVEVKNSAIGDGTKVSHLTYVGDSDLGKDINLGCGVVFVNYDGKTKNRSRVEDHAFIGCNCNLVAPVHIGKNAYLAAGGTITEDVPEDALYVARARGVVKEGWVRQRKEQGKL